MTHWFERFLSDGDGDMESFSFVPSAERQETDEAIHLMLGVPGMDAKDLAVQVTDASVTVKGKRKSESRTNSRDRSGQNFSMANLNAASLCQPIRKVCNSASEPRSTGPKPYHN